MILPTDPFANDPPWPRVVPTGRVVTFPPPPPAGVVIHAHDFRVWTVRSGGQCGADQGGLLGAYLAGYSVRDIEGWAPRRWMTEDGPAPWLVTWGLREHRGAGKGASVAADYAARTVANVKAAAGTLIIGDRRSRGTAKTIEACEEHKRPHLVIAWTPQRGPNPSAAAVEHIRRWLRENRVTELNVAGNRESKAPGIREATANLVRAVLSGGQK